MSEAARGTEGKTERYVEELADEHDYWLTLTDAGRVTRRQEITIRRWVANGALPVRNQRMGLNKRTRHVRASDLQQLTPIVDPTAAISGGPANADLLSIPVQQAQIMGTQQNLVAQMGQIADQATMLGRDLVEQQRAHASALEQLRDEIGDQFTQHRGQIEAWLTAVRAERQQHQAEQERQHTALTQRITAELTTLATAHEQRFRALEAAFAETEARATHQAALFTEVQVGMETLAGQINDTVAQVMRHLQAAQATEEHQQRAIHEVAEALARSERSHEQRTETWQTQHVMQEQHTRALEQRLARLERHLRRPTKRQRQV